MKLRHVSLLLLLLLHHFKVYAPPKTPPSDLENFPKTFSIYDGISEVITKCATKCNKDLLMVSKNIGDISN